MKYPTHLWYNRTMAINTVSNTTEEVTNTRFEGRVIAIRKFGAVRNMSDTLDYTDMQYVGCTEAFVYVGREAPRYTWCAVDEGNPVLPVDVQNRFMWVDVSNHFSWRTSSHEEVTVDVAWTDEMREDLAAYEEFWADAHLKFLEDNKARAIAEARATRRREMNRPVKGKKMVIVKGRKHPVGTVGIVAFLRQEAGYGYNAPPTTVCLLKKEHEWEDRSSPGIWVSADNLMSVDCCPDDHDDCACDQTGELAKVCMADAISRGFKKATALKVSKPRRQKSLG